MERIRIRQAAASDARDIALVHCASWRDAYANIHEPGYLEGSIEAERQSFWSDRFASPDPSRTVFVAVAPSAAVHGFICVYRDLDAEWGSLIDNLHVLPTLRSRGLGERLLRTAARFLSDEATSSGLHLWVFEANEAAVRFYRRLGGDVVERGVSRIRRRRARRSFASPGNRRPRSRTDAGRFTDIRPLMRVQPSYTLRVDLERAAIEWNRENAENAVMASETWRSRSRKRHRWGSGSPRRLAARDDVQGGGSSAQGRRGRRPVMTDCGAGRGARPPARAASTPPASGSAAFDPSRRKGHERDP
ncbi:ribosomal protein S18 acetylase RimI-like enzyme [Roseiarcus fermentans]|uniref:Ribosomal protein S18 acetylase RimI-like enzyme n=1 Tax=Roseiarcus fermentans TaxID=1473586 RepID=A0A366F9T6_9HYPH|nr:N-acetyltransferase [Roseiarcus fermentans]RBP11424.1 ribosomal protein S18 acetylase RimI-like enzyme [Roseiarcus fermentans]